MTTTTVPQADRDALQPLLWPGPDLPPGTDALLAEAAEAGIEWIATLPADWAARPFLDEGEALFVILHEDRAAAIAAISADPFVPDPDTGRLKYIYVRQDMRGRGFAERLLRACLARAGTRWRRIRLHTDNPIAARLYARYGFEPIEGEPRGTHALRLPD